MVPTEKAAIAKRPQRIKRYPPGAESSLVPTLKVGDFGQRLIGWKFFGNGFAQFFVSSISPTGKEVEYLLLVTLVYRNPSN